MFLIFLDPYYYGAVSAAAAAVGVTATSVQGQGQQRTLSSPSNNRTTVSL